MTALTVGPHGASVWVAGRGIRLTVRMSEAAGVMMLSAVRARRTVPRDSAVIANSIATAWDARWAEPEDSTADPAGIAAVRRSDHWSL